MPQIPTKIGKYEVIREIARSNDIVYEAIDPTIGRRVAVKELVMPEALQGVQRRERIERFRREGKAAGRLSHPNIVTVYDVGVDDDRYYMAMELLEGQTLRDALKARGAMPISDVVNYALQLCEALSYAHRQGVIHRDIKPENVQIMPAGLVKLTDFGIARLAGEPSITQDGQVFGTPSYMAPEQITGKDIDTRADLFGLGVIVYEMASGQKPFSGDTVVTITYNILHMDPPMPQGVPPYLARVIRKCLAKNPDERYSTADEIAADIREQKIETGAQPVFSGASASPFGLPDPSPPQPTPQGVTPYGTPVPAYDPHVPSGPFNPTPTGRPPAPAPVLVPPKPVFTSETRSFLGLLFLVVGLAGMLLFAVWAVNMAYKNYQASEVNVTAQKYLKQGTDLVAQGKPEAALKMFDLAAEAAPGSSMAKQAMDHKYTAMVAVGVARSSYTDPAAVLSVANDLIRMRSYSPEGYYFAGRYYERINQTQAAIEWYRKAVQNASGNQQYADAAQQRVDALTGSGATPAPSSGEIPFTPAQ